MNLASIDEHQDRLCEPTALGVFKISVAQFLAGKLEGVTEGDQFMRLKATSARHGTSSRHATPRRTVNKQQNLQYKGASGAGAGETGSKLPPPSPDQ